MAAVAQVNLVGATLHIRRRDTGYAAIEEVRQITGARAFYIGVGCRLNIARIFINRHIQTRQRRLLDNVDLRQRPHLVHIHLLRQRQHREHRYQHQPAFCWFQTVFRHWLLLIAWRY